MTEDFSLKEHVGVLDPETADEMERIVERRRQAYSRTHRARVDAIVEALEE